MKHIVCYSGGHSSALVAIEVARKFGTEDLILLNHDINARVEEQDIKRFKQEVADYLGVPVVYANHLEWDTKDQFDVVVDAGAFKVGNGTALCTHRLKTQPFERYLKANHPAKDVVLYYGFDDNEMARVARRKQILGVQGYASDYPLAVWEERTIFSTKEIGILPPNTYGKFKHANCTGCLKAGKQHWYLVYLYRQDLWQKAKAAEAEIGYSILQEGEMQTLEPLFQRMKDAEIETTEHEDPRTFFARVRKIIPIQIKSELDIKPCECFL